jgi:hypothetical protein
MVEDDIRAAVSRFRAALEQGGLAHVTFERFPHGSCGDACELLGEYLRECGLGDWTYCSGWSRAASGELQSSHAWLERDGLIIDVTADQFGNGQPAVVVSRDRSWHAMFEPMTGARRAGIDYYDPGPAGEPLRADYQTLKRRADALIS